MDNDSTCHSWLLWGSNGRQTLAAYLVHGVCSGHRSCCAVLYLHLKYTCRELHACVGTRALLVPGWSRERRLRQVQMGKSQCAAGLSRARGMLGSDAFGGTAKLAQHPLSCCSFFPGRVLIESRWQWETPLCPMGINDGKTLSGYFRLCFWFLLNPIYIIIECVRVRERERRGGREEVESMHFLPWLLLLNFKG